MLPAVTPYELDVRDTEAGGVTVADLSGELDLTNAPEVERRLLEVAEDRGLVLDLNRVSFVDSAALHMLFRIARRFGEHAPFGIVLEPTALVARTLAIVGIHEVTKVGQTVEELLPAEGSLQG